MAEKLVRNGYGEVIPLQHLRVVNSDAELRLMLRQKLREEVREFLDNPSAEEAADVIEVLEAFLMRSGITKEEIYEAKEHKKELKGNFSKGLVWTKAPNGMKTDIK